MSIKGIILVQYNIKKIHLLRQFSLSSSSSSSLYLKISTILCWSGTFKNGDSIQKHNKDTRINIEA